MADILNNTDDSGMGPEVGPSELSKFSPGLLTFAAIVTGFIMVIGLFGNLLTVVALLKCPKVRNVAAAFIISLCIADFLFCAMVLPFAISGFWTRTWSHGGVLCQLVPFLRYGNVGVSLLSIALITLNRYIMIAHHSWYGRVYRKHNIALMIVFSWLFSYGMQIPTLVGVWGKFDFDPELGTCSILPDDHGRSSKTALFVIAFIVPALLIFICYARIFWVVHSSEQRMREHQRSQHTSPGSLNNSSDKRSTIKDNRETKARRNEWRITKMVLAIFLSFLVCYLPITIAKVADNHVHYPSDGGQQQPMQRLPKQPRQRRHVASTNSSGWVPAGVSPHELIGGGSTQNSIPHRRLPPPVRERMRKPDHLRDNERAVSRSIRGCTMLPAGASLWSHEREMERASRVQLQQYANGAQPSFTGGIQSRPAGNPGPSRPGKIEAMPTHKKLGPSTHKTKNHGAKCSKSVRPAERNLGSKSTSLQYIETTRGSPHNVMSWKGPNIGPKTGSLQSVKKVTRFQVDNFYQSDDIKTHI